jgi:hypothetical protein
MLLLSACVSEFEIPDSVPGSGPGPGGVPGGEPVVTLQLSFPSMEEVNTRAITDSIENRIDSIRLFVFRAGGTTSRLDNIYMYDVSIPTDSINIALGGQTKTAHVKVQNTLYKQYFVLVANPAGLSFPTLTKDVSTLGQLSNALLYSNSWQYEPYAGSFTPFPMWGQIVDSVLIDHEHTPSAADLTVNLIRPVARIEVGVDVNNNTGDPALGFGAQFKIDSVFVCNVNGHGYVAPHEDLVKNPPYTVISKTHTIPSDTRVMHAYKTIPLYNPIPGVVPVYTNAIYVPETDTTDSKPFIVIRAQYYQDNVYYYYRIDFTNGSQYVPLLRNKSFRINITGIRKTGFGSLAEAVASPAMPLNPNLIIGNETDMQDIREIVYDGNIWLGCASTDLKVSWNGCINIPLRTGSNVPITYETVTSVTGFTLSGSNYSFTPNYTGAPRTAVIKIKAGTLSQTIRLTQSGGEYSYLVQAGGTVVLPVRSARIASLPAGCTVSVLSDQSGIVATQSASWTLNQETITIITNNTAGVAVIGLKNSANDTIWSWMVWSVQADISVIGPLSHPDAYAPNYVGAWKMYNNFTFMDYSLGGVAVNGPGPVFQWGRKDVFPVGFESIAGFDIADAPTSNSQSATIAHPMTFYKNPNSPYDWKGDGQHNNLWVTTAGEKGSHDPCPFGWRVPPAENNAVSPWDGFTNGRNGLTFNVASGYNGMNGLPIANADYYWSASARGISAYGYKVGAGGQSAYRANAHPIRCVRDNIRPK